MATQKPISTISYNSVEFLREKLNTWVSSHIIQAYQFIFHKGEDGDKDHIHLRIEPNKKLDPMDLQEQLREYQFGSDKPLGVRPFRPSKEEDWFLYAVHDSRYLALKYNGGDKGEKIPYDWHDIQVSDFYDLEIAFIRAKSYLEHTPVNIASKLQKGENPFNLIMQGENVYTINAMMKALSGYDFGRLTNDYNDLKSKYDKLLFAIEEAGLVIEANENGDLSLIPYPFSS